MTIAELYSLCVGEGGMEPDYFMHRLTYWEALLFIKGVMQRYHPQWECARYVAFYAARPHCRDFDFDKMGTFPWEREPKEPVDKAHEAELLAALRERVRKRDAQLNNI